MANKNYQVNLAFTADTNKAKQQLIDLQNALNKIINQPIKSDLTSSIKDSLREASFAAAELQSHLTAATNIKTGQLDFTKLNQSLKKSNVDLIKYATTLRNIGPQGEEAFYQLANAIATAEVPLRRSNELISKFWDNLKKTAGWQISSNILHGLESSISSAYGYAQDLNESLNNIRIVTGQNIDQMAEFATQANKAAKALSTTTTNYTNASLIYYQQGLSDQEVLERTDVTIKMANVARASAEDVSDQMTAVWNNFYDGSKSLEYYADVMTALGAATASSTEEISAGLNKFAAVAETVGLSYEYAASALATVTSTTRQSADVVGTAFKTLFARIQDLKLGETLDDGTTLGTYSESLAKVGIQIKDTNGEIKDMDMILEEMAEKWKMLDKDAQIALAQNVAGVRQYTQLIALMDNWDFFQENLQTSLASSGTLNEQAEIYAESWEAAQDRVTAALEELYTKLIDDNAFIELLNFITNAIEGLDQLVDSIGGVGGLITSLGAILTKVFSKQLASTISDIGYSIKMLGPNAKEKEEKKKTDLLDQLATEFSKDEDQNLEITRIKTESFREQIELQDLMIQNAEKLSEVEKYNLQLILDKQKAESKRAEKLAQQVDESKHLEDDLRLDMRAELLANKRNAVGYELDVKDYNQVSEDLVYMTNIVDTGIQKEGRIQQIIKDIRETGVVTQEAKNELEELFNYFKQEGGLDFQDDLLPVVNTRAENVEDKLREISSVAQELSNDFAEGIFSAGGIEPTNDRNVAQEYVANRKEQIRATKELTAAEEERKKVAEEAKKKAKPQEKYEFSDVFVKGTEAVLGYISAINMLKSSWDAISNPDLSAWEKFTSIFTSLTILIPTVTNATLAIQQAIKMGKTLLNQETIATTINAAAKKLAALAQRDLNEAKAEGNDITEENIELTNKDSNMNIKDAWKNFSSDFSKAIPKLKQIGTGVLAITAAIALVGVTIYGVTKYVNRFEEAVNEAQKNVKVLTEAANEAKETYEEFKSTLDTYSNAKDFLKDLTFGTIEYTEKVMEANEAARKLIALNGELAESSYVDDNGLIQFKDSMLLQEIQQKQLMGVASAQSSAILAEQQLRDAQQKREQNQILKNSTTMGDVGYGYLNTSMATGIGTGVGALAGIGIGSIASAVGAGALAGSAVPGIGTLIGAIVGLGAGIATMAATGSKTQKETEAFEAVKEYAKQNGTGFLKTEEDFVKALKEQSNISESVAKALYKNVDAIEEWIKVEKENAIIAEAEWKTAFTTKNSANAIYQNSKIKNYINERAYKLSDSEQYRNYAEAYTKNLWKGSNKDLAAEYLRLIYGESNIDTTKNNKAIGENYRITNLGGDSMTIQKKNEEGKWEKIQEITDKEMDALLEEAYIQERLSFSIVDLEREFNLWLQKLNITQQDLINSEGNLLNLYQDTISKLQNDENLDFSEYNLLDVTKLIDNFNANSEKIGKETLLIINEAWEKYSNKFSDDYIDFFNNLSDEEKQVFVTFAIDEQGSKKSIEASWEALSADLKNLTAYINVEIGAKAIKALKDNDFVSLETIYKDELKKTDEQWVAFLEKTGEERYQELAQAYSTNGKIFIDTIDQDITGLEKQVEIKRNITEDKQEKYDEAVAARDAIGNSSERLALALIDSNSDVYQNLSEEDKEKIKNNKAFQVLQNQAKLQAEGKRNIFSTALNDAVNELFTTMNYDEAFISNLLQYNQADIKVTEAENNLNEAKSDENNILTQYKNALIRKAKMEAWAVDKKYVENIELEIERYKELNDQLTIVEKELSYLNKQKDDAYGKTRLNQIDKINKAIQKENELLKQQQDQNKEYLQKDANNIQNITNLIKESGMSMDNIEFDEDDRITNYTSVLESLERQIQEKQQFYKDSSLTEEAYDALLESEVKPLQELIERLEQAISSYDSEWEKGLELAEQLDDNFREWQSNNYESLTYKLELNIEINNMELEEIDYYLNKISDDFKKMGEAAGLAFDKFAHMEESLKDQGDFYNDLTTAYNRGEISPADYVAGMKEARSAIYENLEAIQELGKEMQEYYGKTLDAFGEKIDENIDRMESMTSVLDHYKNIMGILGKEQDYSRIGIILEGTAKTLKDQIEVIRAEYQFYVNEVNEKRALMEQAKAEGNQEVIDLYTKQWEQARDAMIETQDQMLSKTAEWAEAMKAITENKLSKFGEELEKALTGGASFEDMELSLKRTNSLQEEFLTTTNKIYETEKMMRTAQNAIDVSTNQVAKQKLQNFIQETKQLQNQGELSKYELEIQQAKYDLLVAEIALKDAQDAKTTVRLKRDAEGNVGYVYTADQQKVDNALQNFEDAQNALYNIGLEGANTYSEKYQQTLQEMHATLTEINTAWLNGEITSEEEYNRKMLEAKEYYYELLSDYSSLYQVALTTDSAVVRDAWMDDHIDMMNNTEEWQLAVDEYTMLSGEAMQEWQSVVNQVEKDTGLSYSKIQQSVKSVKDESNALRDAINGDNGLIKAMREQINEVDKVVDKYVKEWMPKVIALTDQYEKLAKKIKEAISAESGASSLGGGTEVKEFDKTTDAYQAGYKAGYTLGYEQGYAGTGDKYQVSNHADYNYKKGYDHGYAKGWADGERQREADKKNGSELKYNVEKKNEGYKSAVALMGFDTGGYTGSWGPDGKLAVLHQKEIVLNAADTSNLLASVDLLHNILQVIDVQSMTRQLSGILSSPQFFNNNSQTLEQQVYIEAHFPGATDRNELEAAFNNIINQASQYANRK